SARASEGVIRRIDPVENRIVAIATLDGWISDLAVGGGEVWVAKLQDGVIYRLGEGSLRVNGTGGAGPTPERISLGPGAVWVANAFGRTLSRIDADTGARRTIALEAEPTLAQFVNGVVWTGARPSPQPLPAIKGGELRIAPGFSMNPEPSQPHSAL